MGLRPFHDAHTEADRLVRRMLGARSYTTAFEQGTHSEDVIQLALNGSATRTSRPPPESWPPLAPHSGDKLL